MKEHYDQPDVSFWLHEDITFQVVQQLLSMNYDLVSLFLRLLRSFFCDLRRMCILQGA